MATTNFEDFYEVPNLNFDISKLRDDLENILKLKKFNSNSNHTPLTMKYALLFFSFLVFSFGLHAQTLDEINEIQASQVKVN